MSTIRQTLLAAAFLVPSAGFAQQIVATDATSIANFFLDEGTEPSVETDSTGDPMIKVDYYGADFTIYFYGCDDGQNCQSIQFYSGYRTDGGVRLSKINEWNADNRYAFSYISESGNARIEQDLYLGSGGVNSDDFAKIVGIWVRSVKEFEEHIEW